MTQCSTYTTPDHPPTLTARLVLCKAIHSNRYWSVKSSQPTPNIPLRLHPKQNPYSKTRQLLSHTLHYINPTYLPPTHHPIHNAAAAKSNAVFNTQLCLILHLSALPVWQYTLNATQPSMNQQTVSSLLTAHARQCIASSNAPLYTCSITK